MILLRLQVDAVPKLLLIFPLVDVVDLDALLRSHVIGIQDYMATTTRMKFAMSDWTDL